VTGRSATGGLDLSADVLVVGGGPAGCCAAIAAAEAGALERHETRGIHRRRNFPALNDVSRRSLVLRGVDEHKVLWAS
jgi:succinate dehydrogenase/fumarate reductase flavoprotein subunit